MSCSICCSSHSKLLKCVYCSHGACKSCTEKYLLTQTEGCCMSCLKPWTPEFIAQHFEKSYATGKLYKHYLTAFIDHQKSLFPATLQRIETRKIEAKREEDLEMLDRLERALVQVNSLILHGEDFLAYLPNHPRGIGYYIKDQDFHAGLAQQTSWETTRDYIWGLMCTIMNATATSASSSSNLRCNTEKCIGYLVMVDTRLKCNICKITQCKDCWAVLMQEEHICDHDTIETMKMLTLSDKEFKQCPQCKIHIQKNDGCDQMFCTDCQCAFDWSTNQIIKGRIHNPHYFEWVSRGGVRVVEEERDCREPDALSRGLYRRLSEVLPSTHIFFPLFQLASHLIAREERYNGGDPEETYRELRERLLTGQLAEDVWTTEVCSYRKTHLIQVKRYQLVSAFVMLLTDAFENIIANPEAPQALVFDLVAYFNKHMVLITPFVNGVTGVPKLFLPHHTISFAYNPVASKDAHEFEYILNDDFFLHKDHNLTLNPQEQKMFDLLHTNLDNMQRLLHLIVYAEFTCLDSTLAFDMLFDECIAQLSAGSVLLEMYSNVRAEFEANKVRTLAIFHIRGCYLSRHKQFQECIIDYALELGMLTTFIAQKEKILEQYWEFIGSNLYLKKFKTITNKYKTKLSTYTSVKNDINNLNRDDPSFKTRACFVIFSAVKENPYYTHLTDFPLRTISYKGVVNVSTYPWLLCDLETGDTGTGDTLSRVNMAYYHKDHFKCFLFGVPVHTLLEYLLLPYLLRKPVLDTTNIWNCCCKFRDVLYEQYKLKKWTDIRFVCMQVKMTLLQYLAGVEMFSGKWKAVMGKLRAWLHTSLITSLLPCKATKFDEHCAFLGLSVMLELQVVQSHECVGLLNSRKNLIQ